MSERSRLDVPDGVVFPETMLTAPVSLVTDAPCVVLRR